MLLDDHLKYINYSHVHKNSNHICMIVLHLLIVVTDKMQAPCTNSEAVKQCMRMSDKPLSSQLRYLKPQPPYAAGPAPVRRDRPYSGMFLSYLCVNQKIVNSNIFLIVKFLYFLKGIPIACN